jgi:hypothetical protein
MALAIEAARMALVFQSQPGDPPPGFAIPGKPRLGAVENFSRVWRLLSLT